jgi:hypothetical protein
VLWHAQDVLESDFRLESPNEHSIRDEIACADREKSTVALLGHDDVAPNVHLFSDVIYNNRQTNQIATPAPLQEYYQPGVGKTGFNIPASHPVVQLARAAAAPAWRGHRDAQRSQRARCLPGSAPRRPR